jgi:hypothetical protein
MLFCAGVFMQVLQRHSSGDEFFTPKPQQVQVTVPAAPKEAAGPSAAPAAIPTVPPAGSAGDAVASAARAGPLAAAPTAATVQAVVQPLGAKRPAASARNDGANFGMQINFSKRMKEGG